MATIEECQLKARQCIRHIQGLMREHAEMEDHLAALEEMDRKIVQHRYVEGRTWSAVSMRTYLCERQCQRIGKRALATLLRRMEE